MVWRSSASWNKVRALIMSQPRLDNGEHGAVVQQNMTSPNGDIGNANGLLRQLCRVLGASFAQTFVEACRLPVAVSWI